MKQKLDRTLGMYSALMISIGTMIGSAIFVLAGTSYATAGPGASLAIFLAGIAAVFTGLSFAELVTVVPKAGGGYVYVKEATGNNIIGFICGWGFWLGYAMSCGLFALGFGNFVHYIFPFIPQMATAYVLVVYVAFTNIRGTKSSGNLQNIITTVLIALLALYVVVGVFHIDMGNQKPYTPFGMSGVFNAMGFLYMTYIGYGLITTASEEVIEPEKTIPKAILISIAAVIVIKTSVFFIGSGILPWNELVPGVTDTPMIDTAMKIGGRFGGYLFAFAGILATLSSINTAVMASSRTSFAMARDNRLPGIFKTVNRRTKTPVVSIVATSVIVVVAVSIRDLEHISTVTSIFSLTGYSLVNVALIIFRKKSPELERKFRVPFFPVTPLLGIGVNLFLIIQLAISDFIALAIALGVIAAGHEPSAHALNDIAAAAAELEATGAQMVVLFSDADMARRFDPSLFPSMPSNLHWGIDTDGAIMREIVANQRLATESLPVFIVADTFNRVVHLTQGYTIGLGARLASILRATK